MSVDVKTVLSVRWLLAVWGRAGLIALALVALGGAPASATVISVDHRVFGAFAARGGGSSLARLAMRRRVPVAAVSADGSVAGGSMLYDGGPVVQAMTTHVIYWAPAGYALPAGFTTGFDTFLADLSTSPGGPGNVTGVAPQYVSVAGGALTGGLTNLPGTADGDAFPAAGCATDAGHPQCLTDQQITAELGTLIADLGFSTSIDESYVVVLAPGVRVCFDSSSTACSATSFCGYHSAFYPAGGETTYTVLPYPELDGCTTGGGPHDPSLDAATSIEAHELMETATDPLPGTGYTNASGEEVGDLCAWDYGPTQSFPAGGAFNQTIDGDPYLLQEMWSNIGQSCDQTFSSPLRASIVVTPRVAADDAISYGASLGSDSYPLASITWDDTLDGGAPQQFAATASGTTTFTRPGTYTVWATVTDTAGNTFTAAADTQVLAPPTVQFTWAAPAGGARPQAPISFDAVGSSAAQIQSWRWSFGDGSTGSGPSTTHAFTAAGTYTVAVTVTDTDGLSASATRAIAVRAAPTGGHSGSNSGHGRRGNRRSRRDAVRVASGRTRHRYWLSVRGSGFALGRAWLTIGWRRHARRTFGVRVNRAGRFTVIFTGTRWPLRLIRVRP